jgi:minor extracellular serine protease Vpr
LKNTSKIVLALVCLSIFALAQSAEDFSAPTAQTEEGAESTQFVDETTDFWFVELSSPPTADGTSLQKVRAEKAAFRESARRAAINYSERYAFDVLFNGLSIKIDRSQLSRLAQIPGVKAIYPVVEIRPDFQDNSAELVSAVKMTGADFVQNNLGYTGAGIRVGIIDSGIDYDNPNFVPSGFGAGKKVAFGKDFVGENFSDPNSTPVPDEDPDDCRLEPNTPANRERIAKSNFAGGHGTHVAGIVGANSFASPASGGIRGVAPDVTLGAYRVFGCNGSTFADIMIAAMERALADGMHVVNMSIGSAFQWPQYPTAIASNRLVNRGVVVVTSIGNSGGSGLYSSSAPGVGQKVIGVAALDNTHLQALTFMAAGGQRPYFRLSATTEAPTSGESAPVVHVGRGCVDGNLTTPGNQTDPYIADPAGKVALIERGVCTFNEKYQRAIDSGAVGVVVYAAASAPGIFLGGSVVDRGFFGVSISRADGLALIAAGNPTITWTGTRVSVPNPANAGLTSSFSSYGLAPDLTLKPDIAAPGGAIFSTYPVNLGTVATLSGTSMASPHTAGAVALLLQASPRLNSQVVRNLLQNTADPRVWWGNPPLGLLDNVHRQGAGMLRIDRAIQTLVRTEPSKLSLGEVESGPVTQTITLKNDGGSAVAYDLFHRAALTTQDTTFAPVGFSTQAATASFSLPIDGTPLTNVTVLPGGTASVNVTFDATAVGNRRLFGGYIEFRQAGTTNVALRVPYSGFKGDYQSITAVAPTICSFPFLARFKVPPPAPAAPFSVSCGTGTNAPKIFNFEKVPAGTVFTYSEIDVEVPDPENPDETITVKQIDPETVPNLLFHLAHQVRRLRIELADATTGKSFHRIIDLDYFGRNSTNVGGADGSFTGFFGLTFDGFTFNGNTVNRVPDGKYVMRLTVEKALADATNPAHFESWVSPMFEIDRD